MSFSQLDELTASDFGDMVQTGGFFGLFGNTNKNDKAVLDAVRLKKYDIVAFFVDNDLIESYKCKDENGNTLLHYLAQDYDTTKHIINKILSRHDIKSFVNIQNNNGDTPLILSVVASNHDLCEQLIERGADKKIKNKLNYNVDSETEIDNKPLTVKPLNTFKKQSQIFNPVFEMIKIDSYPANANTSSPRTFTAMGKTDEPLLLSNSVDTENFIKSITKKLNGYKQDNNTSEGVTNELMQKLMKGGCGCNNNTSEATLNFNGGNCDFSDTNDIKDALKFDNEQYGGAEEFDTETIIKTFKSHMQDGGANKHITGVRQLRMPTDGAMDRTHGAELSHIIVNQTSEIIGNIIKKIQEIITKNKKDFEKVSKDVAKATEEVAKVYKTALWSKLRNDPANSTKSALDIAVEIQKILNKELLLEVDYNHWDNVLKENAKNKEAKKTQESSTISLSNATETDNFTPTSSNNVNTFTVSETSTSDY